MLKASVSDGTDWTANLYDDYYVTKFSILMNVVSITYDPSSGAFGGGILLAKGLLPDISGTGFLEDENHDIIILSFILFYNI